MNAIGFTTTLPTVAAAYRVKKSAEHLGSELMEVQNICGRLMVQNRPVSTCGDWLWYGPLLGPDEAVDLQTVSEIATNLGKILELQPMQLDGRGLGYPSFDGDGNETGVQSVDPQELLSHVFGLVMAEQHRASRLASGEGAS